MRKLAFLVLAHTDPGHVARLCRALDYRARIYVHVDAKVDWGPFRDQELPACVHFVEDRLSVSWAAHSQVEATLRMMRTALGDGPLPGHIVMLSGLDYPIRPVEDVYAHLAASPEHDFIRFTDATDTDYRVYFEHYWFLEHLVGWLGPLERPLRHGFGRALRSLLRKPLPYPMRVYWGSAYWALTPETARFVLDSATPEFKRWASTSFAGDEHYFHTLIGNSPLAGRADALQSLSSRETWRLASLHHIDPSMRKIFTLDDLDMLRHSGKFFARKFVSGVSDSLVEALVGERAARRQELRA